MLEKIKANLNYTLCAFLGLVGLIFPAFNFVVTFASYQGERETGEAFTGYGLIGMDKDGAKLEALVGLSGIVQILLLIVSFAMLALGVLGLLKAFGVVSVLPDQIAKFQSKQLAEWGLLANGGLYVFQILLMIIWTSANTGTLFGIRVGLSVTFGAIFTMLLAAAGGAAPKLLPKYVPGFGENAAERVVYRCEKCGKKANKNAKFCTECGGAVVEVKPEVAAPAPFTPMAPVAPAAPAARTCAKCGKELVEGQRFCTGCGTMVE